MRRALLCGLAAVSLACTGSIVLTKSGAVPGEITQAHYHIDEQTEPTALPETAPPAFLTKRGVPMCTSKDDLFDLNALMVEGDQRGVDYLIDEARCFIPAIGGLGASLLESDSAEEMVRIRVYFAVGDVVLWTVPSAIESAPAESAP